MTATAPPHDHSGPLPAGVIAQFLLAVVIWSSTWVVIKDQVGLAAPGWTIVVRFAIATLGMVVLAVVRGESLRLPPAALGTAALVGLTQFCLNFQFVYRAEQAMTSGIMALLMATIMIPTAVLARLFYGDRIDRRFVAGSAVALAGIGLLLLKEYRAAPPGAHIAAGLGFGFAAVLSAAVATAAQLGRAARAAAPVPLMAWAMGLGTLLDLVLAFVTAGPPPMGLPGQFWAGAVYLSIIGTVVPFPLYVGLIRRLGAGRATYVNVCVPVLAMAISTLLEGYRWTLLAVAGAVLAMAGLLIVMRARRSGP